MDVCARNHDEIVYDSRHCPLCEAKDEIEDLNNYLQENDTEIAELQKALEEANDRYDKLVDAASSLAPEILLV